MKKSLVLAIAFTLIFAGFAYSIDQPVSKPTVVQSKAVGEMDWKTVRRDVTFGEGVKLTNPKWMGLRFGVKKEGKEQVSWFCLDTDTDNMPTVVYFDANGDFVLDADERHEVTKYQHGTVMALFEIEIAGHKESFRYKAFADKKRRKLTVVQDGDQKTRVIIGWDPQHVDAYMDWASDINSADIFSLRLGTKYIVLLGRARMNLSKPSPYVMFSIVSRGSNKSAVTMMGMNFVDVKAQKMFVDIEYPTAGGARKTVKTEIHHSC